MNRVVVTGVGAITPVGNDVGTMWENLLLGRHGIGTVTKFDTEGYKSTLAAEVKGFDPLLYMEKNETRRLDLYSQYAIAAAVQAVQDSGIEGKIDPNRFSTCFGSGIGGIVTFENEHSKLVAGGPRKVSPMFIPMMIANLAAGNLAIRFNARGSCTCVVTACATGADAIGSAYRAIKHGYTDAAIAGGSEAAITQMGVSGFMNMTALTTSSDPDAASMPFDRRRSGFVIGEGAGAVILEEYNHALARGAKIYGEVKGYGATCDAHHITAPAPDGDNAARAIKDAYTEAGGAAGAVYINAHGTGTPLNDVTEARAIKTAFGGDTSRVFVSSTKSMTGHMLGAAGAVEAIISLFALRDGKIPPTVGLYDQDPECDIDCVPQKAREISPELALSVSLGFGGHNACLAFSKV